MFTDLKCQAKDDNEEAGEEDETDLPGAPGEPEDRQTEAHYQGLNMAAQNRKYEELTSKHGCTKEIA
jgi:hypothetical protein